MLLKYVSNYQFEQVLLSRYHFWIIGKINEESKDYKRLIFV